MKRVKTKIVKRIPKSLDVFLLHNLITCVCVYVIMNEWMCIDVMKKRTQIKEMLRVIRK